MNYWNKTPLFRLLIPLIIGIVFSIYFAFNKELAFNFSILLFIGLNLIFYFKSYFSDYKKRWYFGITLNLFLFFFGIFITEFQKPENKTKHYTKFDSEISAVRLIEDVVVKQNSNKCEVEVIAIKRDSNWVNTNGKAILYLAKDTLSNSLSFGDELLINSKWKVIDLPTNPAQFNYKNYLYNSGIIAQQYVTNDKWKISKKETNLSVRKHAFVYQKRLLNTLKNNFEDDELSVLSALLLGYKDLLGRDVIMTYASSGAMHVLAVSGLHVGIIFMVLNFFLSFLNSIKFGNYLKAFILIIALWIYALITGMSPSVLRATTMFSFIIIGGALKRDTNIYNTLAASAFVLLIYNPFIILQVGFQLSYAAVLGIVYLQPKLHNLYRPSSWLLDKVWAISAVSIAAQIATFPLGMFYFHQFPNYFLLSNLFVIPLATFIIGFGVFLFLISWYLPLSNLIVLVLNKLLLFLNFSVDWVQSLPHSLTVGVSVYKMETFLIYLIIILLIPAVIKRSFKLIKIAISLSVLLVIYQIYEKVTLQNQQYFIVYDVKGEQAIDFVDGSNNYFIADENLANDQSKMRFHIHHFRWERRVLESNLVSVDFLANNYLRAGNHIKFFDKKILLWDKDFKKPTNLAALQLDYIIVSEKANINLENINCKLLIIDSSVDYYKEEVIKKECLKWDIPFYDVNTEGAYLFEINA